MRYVLVLVLILSSLYADRDGGPYIGLGYGTSTYNDDGCYASGCANNSNTPEILTQDKSEAMSIYAGAYINKYLSVELNYTDFSLMAKKGYEVDTTKKIEFYAITVSTMVHYAFFDDILDFHARYGVGKIKEHITGAKGFTKVYGLGSSVRFSEMVSLKIAYDMYTFGYDSNGDNSSDFNQDIRYIYTALELQF